MKTDHMGDETNGPGGIQKLEEAEKRVKENILHFSGSWTMRMLKRRNVATLYKK